MEKFSILCRNYDSVAGRFIENLETCSTDKILKYIRLFLTDTHMYSCALGIQHYKVIQ